MIYIHSSEHAHTNVVPPTTEQESLGEREDSISVMDDSSSVASALTVQSSSKSVRAKRKVWARVLSFVFSV